jgi:hypothetical protein
MSTYHFYDPATGRFTGQSFEGSGDQIPENNPGGLPYAENVGRFYWLKAVVDGKVVDRTFEILTEAQRANRNELLKQSDWVTAAAVERGEAVSQVWRAYRQALRDVPQQAGFPQTIEWPEPPAG